MLADTNVTATLIVFGAQELVAMGVVALLVLVGTLCRRVLVAIRELATLAARRRACVTATCTPFAASEVVAV